MKLAYDRLELKIWELFFVDNEVRVKTEPDLFLEIPKVQVATSCHNYKGVETSLLITLLGTNESSAMDNGLAFNVDVTDRV